jgi:5-methylcytosine-specific restriction protein A
MPFKPKRSCCFHGCPKPAIKGSSRCAEHTIVKQKEETERKRRVDERRPTAVERGYGSKWQAARAGYLAKHPLCVDCESRGIVEPATVVDHVVPHQGNMKLIWDSSNWQALCGKCHSRKTVKRDGGFGNKPRDVNRQ